MVLPTNLPAGALQRIVWHANAAAASIDHPSLTHVIAFRSVNSTDIKPPFVERFVFAFCKPLRDERHFFASCYIGAGDLGSDLVLDCSSSGPVARFTIQRARANHHYTIYRELTTY